MKQVNKICILVVASSTFAGVTSTVGAQDYGFGKDREPTTLGRIQARFEPLGVHLGGMVLNASMGVNAGYVSNAKYTATNAQSDTILTAAPAVTLASIWSRHSIGFGVSANANKYTKFDKENTTDWAMFANGRFDVSGRTHIGGSLNIGRGTEGRDSGESPVTLLRPVRTNKYGGGVTFETNFNRLRFLGSVSANKYKYNGVTGSGPGIFNEHQRDLTILDSTGRLDYAVSPDTSVYVFTAINRHEYETNKTQDSDGGIVALGASFNFSELITGEAEAGVLKQNYKKFSNTENNSYYHANVVWSPTPLTSVTGTLGRSENVTSAVGAYGVLHSEANVTVDHELLRNVLISGGIVYSEDQFHGTIATGPTTFRPLNRNDKRNNVFAKVDYYLSNRVSINTEIRHEKLDSSGLDKFKAYNNNVVRVGLKLNY